MKYNSSSADEVIGIVDNSLTTVDGELVGSIANDFSSFSELNLFSDQLAKIKEDANNLKTSQEALSLLLKEHKGEVEDTEEDVNNEINKYVNDYNLVGAIKNLKSSNDNDKNVSIEPEVRISNEQVKNFVSGIDNSTAPILLNQINYYKGEDSIIEMLISLKKARTLVKIIKTIQGDNTGELDISDEDAYSIQKVVLKKVNTEGVDLTTSEGASTIEKKALEKPKTTEQDQEKWNELLYGSGKVKKVSLLDGEWTVVNTKNDIQSYEKYILDNGVRQNSDTSKYSDYCLAFSYVHAHDLYTGGKGTATMAGNYTYAGEYEDFISDDKSKVLQKIYSEVASGKPVVLQVNGNKAGTSRHFVTVVGFKSSVNDPSKLTEKDLLIIDSWDGKLERMDTSYSRFMTTGAQCKKEYSGYRLRVLKSNVA